MHTIAATTWIICAALVAAFVLWIVASWRSTRYTFFQSYLYLVNAFFTRVLWRTEVSGPLPVAEGQGAVIVCNHASGIDPLLIQLCTDRVVHWMVAREYYEMIGISVVFRTLGSIRVNRGGVDTASTKTAIRLCQQGGLVGLFPEARVNTTGDLLLPGRSGAALIALKARVIVIPCWVEGAPYDGTALGSFFMAAKARVRVGEAIDLSPYFGREGDKAVLQELTKKFMVEIARLAGDPDYQPKLAGRNWTNGDDEVEAVAEKLATHSSNGQGDADSPSGESAARSRNPSAQ